MAKVENQLVAGKKVGYLGPRGTFSEEIALGFYRGVDGQFMPYATIDAVIRAVDSGEVDEGIVPVENSVEGSVNITLDTLAHDVDLYVVKEIIQPVKHNLLVKEGTKHINVVLSHVQALAQCRRYLNRNYPGAELVPVDSTAAAAYQVASGAKNHAAIGSIRAAELYGLQVLDKEVQDDESNSTRFFVVAKRPAENVAKGKTAVICQIKDEERAGSLYDILGEFAARQVNLTKIESRPARSGLGVYIFFFDIEGTASESNIEAALAAVREKTKWFKSLGSYPVYKAEELW